MQETPNLISKTPKANKHCKLLTRPVQYQQMTTSMGEDHKPHEIKRGFNSRICRDGRPVGLSGANALWWFSDTR